MHLCEIDWHVASEIVHRILRVGHITRVAVKGYACKVRTDGGVFREDLGILRIVPIVFVTEDAGRGVRRIAVLAIEIPAMVAQAHLAQRGTEISRR